MATTVEYIAEALFDAGCRHAFGIPGGEVLSMMDALDRAGIAFHLCKHENAGGFMAEGSHHASGAPGILLATIGPGLANAINSVVNAWQDQVPLLVLSGCADRAVAESYTHQVFDQAQLMRPITKGSFTVTEKTAFTVISKAIILAMADPPGPVHIDIPISLAAMEQPPKPRFETPVVAKSIPARDEAFSAAQEKLARAKRPLMIAGVGAVHHNAHKVIRTACERFNMPLITTYKAKGVLDETHPLALGGHGLSPLSDEIVLPLVKKADCIVLAGYDPIEMRPGWYDPWAPEVAVEFSHIANRHGMHGAGFSHVGHIGASLTALIKNLELQGSTWPGGEYEAVGKALACQFGDRQSWGPHQAFSSAFKTMPDGAVVSVDTGAHRILLSQMWKCRNPREMLQSSALCTMGVALPLAIGHKLAAPDCPVLAVTGDAGLEMVLGELATLRDIKLPVVIMVMVDRSLALIEMKQRRSQFNNLGVDFGATDFAELANIMGGIGRNASDAATLESELVEAWQRQTFSLIACQIDKRAYDSAF